MVPISQEYSAGVCNIGATEIAARRRAGWIGVAATVVLWAAFFAFRVAAPWRLFLALPAAMAASGFFQAAFRFCANFGMRGIYNFGVKLGDTTAVGEVEARRQDRRKAARIILYSGLVGIAVALIGFFAVF